MNYELNHTLATRLLKATIALFLAFSPIMGVSDVAATHLSSPPIVDRSLPASEPLPSPPIVSSIQLPKLPVSQHTNFPVIQPPDPPDSQSLNLRRAADFTFVQSADTGTEDPTGVYNGDRMTYTIVLRNENTTPLTNILIKDLLPPNTLDRIICTENCEFIIEENEIPEPTGGTIIVTATREISWSFPTLVSGSPITVEFSARMRGQPEGSIFTNYVFATAIEGVTPVFASGNETLGLTAHVRIQAGGGASISEVPTWFSEDIGGTIDQDWGDFDRDGDLDLALGSSVGASVYRNESGRLTRVPISISGGNGDQRLSYGVRWADVDQDPQQRLELIVIGNSENHSADSPGLNYIYSYDQAIEEFVQFSTFTSKYQLVRLAPSDYDGDGDVDIVASSNAIVAPGLCPIALYRNDGTGHFTATVLITDTLVTASSPDMECLSSYATAALGPADYDRDGDIDLAIGVFPTTIQLLVNDRNGQVVTQTNPFTTTSPIDIETDLEYLPYDLAWGDYDQDGYLDLAAAYPIQREVRIYRNRFGDGLNRLDPITQSLRTAPFMTPLSIEWGDFNGDGHLELAVADSPPKIYQYVAAENKFVWLDTMALPPSSGQVWSVRGIALSSGGLGQSGSNLDLAMSNRGGPSQLFTTLAPQLKPTITPVSTRKAGSVAWGDYDHDLDADLDLLLGCSNPPDISSFLYVNKDGDFGAEVKEFTPSGFGPHVVAFGDATGDNLLDLAIGTPNKIQVYQNGTTDPATWNATTESPIHSLAWGDANDDGKLDLLVGRYDGTINLFLNQGTQLTTTPAITITAPGDVRSLAWGDFDGDYYLDFAAGIYDGAVQIYQNDGGPLQPDQAWSFSLAWTAPSAQPTRALAWADYDNDGDVDLAVGNDGADDHVWENDGGVFATSPVWSSNTPLSKTTSLDWGDWDNDGYLDLAVGHDGEPDVVYANIGSTPGSPQLFVLWKSAESYATTGVAWGDRDGDGDLDLAISQASNGGQNGFYENTLVAPAHLPDSAAQATSLINPPSYLYIDRPGETRDAYFYSSPEVLAMPAHPTVTVRYKLYDPENSPVAATYFDYSLDDGSHWQPARQAAGSPDPITQTLNTGQEGVFVWDAAYDDAVSDNARFRVRVVHQRPVGPVRSASSSAVSPPFRVRALDCIWPADVSITVTPEHPDPGQSVTFNSYVASPGGPGSLSYRWDFGDGTMSSDLIDPYTTHTYCCGSTPVVILRVTGPACPVLRPAYARVQMVVGLGDPDIFLPLVLKSYAGSAADALVNEEPVEPETRAAEERGDWETGRLKDRSSPPIHQSTNLPTYQSTSLASNVTRVTRYRLGANSRPTISEDGTRVAFWTTGRLTGQNDDGNVEIFLAEISSDGSVVYTQITSSTGTILGGFNFAPTIDDAGQRIAFFSDRDLVGLNSDRNFEVFLADIDSTIAITQVTQTPKGFNILPDLSGDGRFLAFASNNDIYRAEVARAPIITPTWFITHTRITAITEEGGSGDQPSINDDGRFIAFISDQNFVGENPDGNREVFLAEISGTVAITQVTDSAGGINDLPSISADGNRIAFLSDRDLVGGQNPNGVRQIFVAEFITATRSFTVTQITTGSEDKDQPSISADGKRVAFISVNNRQLHLYDLYGEEPVDKVKDTSGGKAYPAISANGTDVVYVSNWNIFRANYPLTDMSVSKSADRIEVEPGDIMTFTLVVANNGPSLATDVKLTDTLPYGMQPLLPNIDPDDYIDETKSDFANGENLGAGIDWNSSGWLHLQDTVTNNPFELPDAGGSTDSWANMQDNVLLLHMNGNWADTAPTPIPVSCVQCPSSVSGKMGVLALQFDGSDDYLYADHSDISNLGPATWMMWVRRDTATPGTLLYRGDADQYEGWWINFRSATELGFSGAIVGMDGQRYTQNVPEVDTWFHLAVTWDGSSGHNGIRVYVDGQEAHYSTKENSSFSTVPATSLLIGKGGTHAPQPFDGTLDEVAIYRRVFSAEEIQTTYLRQVPRRTAYFDSRVMTETTGTGAWSAIGWLPQYVVGQELPDEGGIESGYPMSNVSMTGTVLLLHLNDPGGSSAFLDTSGEGNDGYCFGVGCPIAGASGRFKRALRFDGVDDYVEVQHSDSLNSVGDEFTMAAWVKSHDLSGYQAIANQYGFYTGYFLGLYDNHLYVEIWDSMHNPHYVPGGWGSISAGVWTHLAVTWRKDGSIIGYINGQEVGTIPASGHPIGINPIPLRLGAFSWDPNAHNVKGLIDEVAIFDRALTLNEIETHYLRGVLRMSFQVRTCEEPKTNCTPFVGPDGTRGTTFSDSSNPRLSPPEFLLNVANNPYLQYRLYMDSYTSDIAHSSGITITPQLDRVEVKPRVTCDKVYTGTVACTLGSDVAPLLTNSSITIELPVEVISPSVYYGATLVNGHLMVTNTAQVIAWESDPDLQDNTDSEPTRLKPIPLNDVTIGGTSTGMIDTVYIFTAAAKPTTAMPSVIEYTWQATDHPTPVVHTSGFTDAIAFTWDTAGVKTVTVEATNDGATIVNDTHVITIENPVPVLSSISPMTATAGGPAFTLTANGSNFVNGSIVRWNGSDRTTSFVSSTQLTATIPDSDIATTGTVTITVFNPGPGGGTSSPKTFTITLTILASNLRRGSASATPALPEAAATIKSLDVIAATLRSRSRRLLETP